MLQHFGFAFLNIFTQLSETKIVAEILCVTFNHIKKKQQILDTHKNSYLLRCSVM